MVEREVAPPSNEPHPLVALPRPVSPDQAPHPSPLGRARKTGALSVGTLARTRAVAEALFTVDDRTVPPSERLDWVMEEYADFMARTSRRGRLLFTLAAQVVTRVSPWLRGRLGGFLQCSLTERVEMLRAFEATPLAGVLIALRAILCILYYEHPGAAADAGMWLGPDGSP